MIHRKTNTHATLLWDTSPEWQATVCSEHNVTTAWVNRFMARAEGEFKWSNKVHMSQTNCIAKIFPYSNVKGRKLVLFCTTICTDFLSVLSMCSERRVLTLATSVDSGRAQASSYPGPHVWSRGPQLLPLLMFLTCSVTRSEGGGDTGLSPLPSRKFQQHVR